MIVYIFGISLAGVIPVVAGVVAGKPNDPKDSASAHPYGRDDDKLSAGVVISEFKAR